MKLGLNLSVLTGNVIVEDFSSHPSGVVRGLLKVTTPDGILYQNEGWNGDDFSSPDITESTLIKTIENLLGFSKGQYKVEFKVVYGSPAGEVIGHEQTYNYDLDTLSGSLSAEADYNTSTLLVSDDTNYVQEHSGVEVTPIFERNISIHWPVSLNKDPEESSLEHIVIGPNIYTGIYQIILETTLEYQLQTQGGDVIFTVVMPVNRTETFEVERNTCYLQYANCIMQIETRFTENKGFNDFEAEWYRKLRYEADYYFALYDVLRRAGMDTGYACGKLQEIFSTVGNCVDENEVVEIIPITGYSGGTGSTVTWHDGLADPSSTLGVNGDYYLKHDGKIYKKVDGSWVFRTELLYEAKRTVKTVDSDYTVSSGETVLVNSLLEEIDITLPSIDSETKDITIVSDQLIYPVTIVPTGGAKINRENNYVIGTQGDSVTLAPVNDNWVVV